MNLHIHISPNTDYQPGGYLVNFTASPTGPGIASFSIKTFSDNVLEEREEFLTSLSIPQEFSDRVQEGSPSMAMVEIIDNTSQFTYSQLHLYIRILGYNERLSKSNFLSIQFLVFITNKFLL